LDGIPLSLSVFGMRTSIPADGSVGTVHNIHINFAMALAITQRENGAIELDDRTQTMPGEEIVEASVQSKAP